MAKQGVVPDELTKPFWDAANEGRLVIQNCKACNRLQHPPAPTCDQCGSRAD
jgi:3-oxo-4,17-pregnadiene-20-carboxyl-CoA hydratase alpha subunit